MANPQAEDGHVDIANEVVEALSRTLLAPDEWRCLMAILRKTWGWHKKEDWISLSQFVLMTGIRKPNVCRALSKLITKNLIIRTDNDRGKSYRFQKDFDRWPSLSKQITLSKLIMPVIRSDNKSLSKQIPTKENSTKETLTKEKDIPSSPTSPKNPEVKTFIDFWYQTFKAKFGKPYHVTGKDGDIVKRLLATCGLQDLKDLAEKFFTTPDEFIFKAGYTIGVFSSQINKLSGEVSWKEKNRLIK